MGSCWNWGCLGFTSCLSRMENVDGRWTILKLLWFQHISTLWSSMERALVPLRPQEELAERKLCFCQLRRENMSGTWHFQLCWLRTVDHHASSVSLMISNWNMLELSEKELPHLDTRSLHLLISTYTYIILHISTYLAYLYFIHRVLYVYNI